MDLNTTYQSIFSSLVAFFIACDQAELPFEEAEERAHSLVTELLIQNGLKGNDACLLWRWNDRAMGRLFWETDWSTLEE